MDIESVARKLEPVRPKDVQHWLRVRETADSETKDLIERRIREVAYEELGEFHKKILLSLPPEHKAKGTFHLGTVLYEKSKWPLGLSSNELLQNLAIFGRSGAGKTNVVFHLVEQLTQKRVPWLFWDWKRTARHLLPRLRAKVNIYTPGRSLSPFIFNPFITPPGLETHVYIAQLVDVMATAFTLGDGARSILQKAIAACYRRGLESPSVEDVLKEVEQIPSKERVSGWKTSALRALETLAFSKVAGTTRLTQEELAKALLKGNTIIELDALSDSTKQFLIPILSLWLYAVRLASREREKLNLVIIVEEAHHVLYRSEHRSKESVMNRLLRQCRELGIGIIVVDQHPHLISSAALGNTYASICLNLKDPSDINRAAGLSQVSADDKHYFSMLPVGQGIVKLQDRWRQPILVQFPHVDVAKGVVTDDLLRRYVSGALQLGELRRDVRQDRDESNIGSGERLLTLDEFQLLHDVLQNPEDGVKERYLRLGWSGDRGNTLKERLLNRGWLTDSVVKLGKTRKVVLGVPSEGQDRLAADFAGIPPAFVTHEYWKRYFAMVLEDLGYRIEFEAERKGGRVDVLATNDRERIGVEIETGKSDVLANVRHCLLSGFTTVLVVATDENAMTRVEHTLGSEGLLLPDRITLALRDKVVMGKFAAMRESAWVG